MNDIKIYLILFLLLVTGVVLYKKNKHDFNNSPAIAQTAPFPKFEPKVEPKPAPVVPKTSPEPEYPKVINTYEDALKVAKATKKNIFLYFGAEWCHFCVQMKRTTLSDAAVKKTLEGYVVFMVDKDRNPQLARKYNVTGIPAYMVINGDEKIIKRTTGLKEKAEFLAWLQ